MKRIRTFILRITTFAQFAQIRSYLMSKYNVYTAIYKNSFSTFTVSSL